MPKLIVALDYDNAQDALSIAKSLIEHVEWVKVGLELFTQEGPHIIKSLKSLGFKTMLDLKLFDIPNTVQKSVRSACLLDVDIITLHILGGETMIKNAVQEAQILQKKNNHETLLFGVTVLTSMKEGELPGYTQNLQSLIIELTKNAQSWGLNGVVCSGQEIAALKKLYPSLLYLTPGIRMVQTQNHDQERVMTPKEALIAGSNFLVVGRPITQAENPLEAAKIYTSIIQDPL